MCGCMQVSIPLCVHVGMLLVCAWVWVCSCSGVHDSDCIGPFQSKYGEQDLGVGIGASMEWGQGAMAVLSAQQSEGAQDHEIERIEV